MMQVHPHLALHCAAAFDLTRGLRAFDRRQDELVWALMNGVERLQGLGRFVPRLAESRRAE